MPRSVRLTARKDVTARWFPAKNVAGSEHGQPEKSSDCSACIANTENPFRAVDVAYGKRVDAVAGVRAAIAEPKWCLFAAWGGGERLQLTAAPLSRCPG